MTQITTPKLLIDGDLILYKCSSATEHAVRWDDNDNWVLHANFKEAQELVQRSIEELTTHIKADTVVVCLSDRENFRKDISPDYKSHRKEIRKPIIYPELRAWTEDVYDVVCWPRLEADDVLGIMATTPGNEECIIASEDKDLQTIPCRLWRQGLLTNISPDRATYFWMLQTLTGDPTDGYKGCPGIGEKKAEAVLKTPPYWSDVVNAYRKAGLTEDDALMNARLARILRHEDYKDGKIQLWEPERALKNAA